MPFPGLRDTGAKCNIDHVVPYPIGWTHAANMVCLCRKHHHLKTFSTGDFGVDTAPDGAGWTSPTGSTYPPIPAVEVTFPSGNHHRRTTTTAKSETLTLAGV